MNRWTKVSIEFANQRNYRDELFRIYPIEENYIREIEDETWQDATRTFEEQDARELIRALIKMETFPFTDSYIAHSRRDNSASAGNPKTLQRIAARPFAMALDDISEACWT